MINIIKEKIKTYYRGLERNTMQEGNFLKNGKKSREVMTNQYTKIMESNDLTEILERVSRLMDGRKWIKVREKDNYGNNEIEELKKLKTEICGMIWEAMNPSQPQKEEKTNTKTESEQLAELTEKHKEIKKAEETQKIKQVEEEKSWVANQYRWELI